MAIVATLSVAIYLSSLNDQTVQNAEQQLATVRIAAVAVQGEVQSLTARLKQFSSLPSVQSIDVPFVGQRLEAAFGDNPNNIMRYVVRIDASKRLYSWTPNGQLQDSAIPTQPADATWQQLMHPSEVGRARVSKLWWLRDAPPHMRAVTMPVYRTSASVENPVPTNDFNGVLAIVFDLNAVATTYLGPAVASVGADRIMVGIATPDFGLRIGSDVASVVSTMADPHGHQEHEGTSMLSDGAGRRLHAWAKLDAAGEEWLVASSLRYEWLSGEMRDSARAQLALTAVLLIVLPLAAWLVWRRERSIEAEQRQLERRLADAQKMEAIGKLAGGVAHDFNNMLTAILGYASMIHEDAPAGSPVRDQAHQIRRAAESAASLTQKLLAFSRRQLLHSDPLDFASLLGNLLPLVRGAVGEDIKVSTQTSDALWPIMADPVQLEQAILNLAINARDAMPKGGSLQIDSRNAPRPTGERRHDTDVKPGEYVQITVTDTGVGMDEATRNRMFEPFFTTKTPGTGTGLGLSTVYGFVRQCGGFISVLSTPGKGTSIELLLPRAKTAAITPPTPAMRSDVPAATLETVLLAEDEESVRQLTLETLQRRGYHVLSAASGEEALKIAAAYEGTIHVLVSDVVMPGMKGPELAERLRALRPGVKVLFVSGYAADVVTPNDLREASLLSKPFSPTALGNAVRAILDVPLSSTPASQP